MIKVLFSILPSSTKASSSVKVILVPLNLTTSSERVIGLNVNLVVITFPLLKLILPSTTNLLALKLQPVASKLFTLE